MAGCMGAETTPADDPGVPPETADAATPQSDRGSISGIVLDDEQMPVAGVTVALVESANETRSAQDGRFTFNGLEPGSYTLVATRVGFDQTAQKAQVVAGEVAELEIRLKPIRVAEPWVWVYEFTRDVLAGNYIAASPNNVQTWAHRYELADNPWVMEDLFFEVRWEPSTVLADGIRFASGIDAHDGDRPLCSLEGNAPLDCLTPREALAQDWGCEFDEEEPDDSGCHIEWVFRPGGSSVLAAQAGLWPDEAITVYSSHFFRQAMPAGYSGAPPE